MSTIKIQEDGSIREIDTTRELASRYLSADGLNDDDAQRMCFVESTDAALAEELLGQWFEDDDPERPSLESMTKAFAEIREQLGE